MRVLIGVDRLLEEIMNEVLIGVDRLCWRR